MTYHLTCAVIVSFPDLLLAQKLVKMCDRYSWLCVARFSSASFRVLELLQKENVRGQLHVPSGWWVAGMLSSAHQVNERWVMWVVSPEICSAQYAYWPMSDSRASIDDRDDKSPVLNHQTSGLNIDINASTLARLPTPWVAEGDERLDTTMISNK